MEQMIAELFFSLLRSGVEALRSGKTSAQIIDELQAASDAFGEQLDQLKAELAENDAKVDEMLKEKP